MMLFVEHSFKNIHLFIWRAESKIQILLTGSIPNAHDVWDQVFYMAGMDPSTWAITSLSQGVC